MIRTALGIPIWLVGGAACAQDCADNAQNQSTLTRCADESLKKSDADLNARYRAIQMRVKALDRYFRRTEFDPTCPVAAQ